MNMKLSTYFKENKKQLFSFSFPSFILKLIIGFILLFFFFALNDFNKYYLKKEEICRIDNVINIDNGKVCYGISNSIENNTNWIGNHIWEMKDGNKLDKTCSYCVIEKTNGCLNIVNSNINISFSSLSNFFISFYYKNLFFIKKIYEYKNTEGSRN